jgi:hypothetical protein
LYLRAVRGWHAYRAFCERVGFRAAGDLLCTLDTQSDFLRAQEVKIPRGSQLGIPPLRKTQGWATLGRAAPEGEKGRAFPAVPASVSKQSTSRARFRRGYFTTLAADISALARRPLAVNGLRLICFKGLFHRRSCRNTFTNRSCVPSGTLLSGRDRAVTRDSKTDSSLRFGMTIPTLSE